MCASCSYCFAYLSVFLFLFLLPLLLVQCRYGFEKNPRLKLHAKPKLGHREVTLSYVTDWIEKKLCEVVEVSREIDDVNL